MISKKTRDLLRSIVLAQDRGEPVAEILAMARYESTFVDRLMVAADNERLKMRHEGLDVHIRSGDTGFILGLVPYMYKTPCEHEWYYDGDGLETCPMCGETRPCIL